MRSFDEMNRMFREMDRAFDQLRSAWLSEFDTPGFGPALERGSEHEMMPSMVGDDTAATLEDEGDRYVYVMDLPGFEKSDIELTFDDGVLSIRAQTDVEEGSDAYRSVRSRRVGRQVPIPKAIVTDEITASYHNGVLEVHLPIVDDDRDDDGHHIEIE
ncbi:Hsp20/alpha crystallin family protein [Natronorubrum aibiense]|uniref:Hsp20 family protein n=1 Tax=Natronorubrum aibiense TaxID=348826 RepID=A0A5P9P004_9EURY|nr:Hsp20/alpha crystallin family protein [Natronorubrum aibiense]QFU81478.1 Hsp20 family protein [Natronorubrum aibiense]